METLFKECFGTNFSETIKLASNFSNISSKDVSKSYESEVPRPKESKVMMISHEEEVKEKKDCKEDESISKKKKK